MVINETKIAKLSYTDLAAMHQRLYAVLDYYKKAVEYATDENTAQKALNYQHRLIRLYEVATNRLVSEMDDHITAIFPELEGEEETEA